MADKSAAEGEQRFNVMSHQLVPTHILLNEKEEAEVLGKKHVADYNASCK